MTAREDQPQPIVLKIFIEQGGDIRGV